MFQAINQTKQPFYSFFFTVAILSSSLGAAPASEIKSCSLSEKGVPDEFFLSRAFQEQRDGLHKADQNKVKESKSHFETSISFFDKYHVCRKEKNLGPTYISAMSLANNYLELGNFDQALTWSDNAYRMFDAPKIPPREIILQKARIHLKKGDLEPAAKVLEVNLKSYPFDLDFLFYLGNIYYDLKQWNRSVLYFISLNDVIQKRDSGSKLKPTILKFLGDLNYKLDYSRKSIEHYRNYLVFAPNDTEVLFRVAQIYFTLGEFGSAKKFLSKIRELNPREIDASHMLGEMYFLDSRVFSSDYFTVLTLEKKIPKEGIILLIFKYLRGEVNGLETEVLKFLEKNPNRLSAQVLYADLISSSDTNKKYKANLDAGQWAFQYRQYMTAEKYFSRALKIAKDTSDLNKDIPILYEKISHCKEAQNKIQSAILVLRAAKESSNPQSYNDQLNLRMAYLLMGQNVKKFDESLQIINQLITAHPNTADYHYMKGILYSQKEDYKNALPSFIKAVEIDPNNTNHVFYLAIAYDKQKDFKNAEKYFQKSIELSPENANAYNYLGYLYAEKGINKEKSEELLIKATNLEPDNAAYQDSIGWIYFKQNRLSEALLHLHFAEQVSGDRDQEDPVIFEHLGDVYSNKGDLVKAEFYLNQAYKITKDPEESQKINAKLKKVKKDLDK
ncbi:MAG: tetratricopeptide repeat protein [Leptospira sp.]|nr:tetratricopeptide repeat protein [Leptospira sp.]